LSILRSPTLLVLMLLSISFIGSDDMKGAHGHAEFRHVLGVRHAQSVLSHVVDMRGPGVDEGHVLTRVHHMGAGVSTDRASSDNGYLAAHDFHSALGSDTRNHAKWLVGPDREKTGNRRSVQWARAYSLSSALASFRTWVSSPSVN